MGASFATQENGGCYRFIGIKEKSNFGYFAKASSFSCVLYRDVLFVEKHCSLDHFEGSLN